MAAKALKNNEGKAMKILLVCLMVALHAEVVMCVKAMFNVSWDAAIAIATVVTMIMEFGVFILYMLVLGKVAR